MTNRWRQPGRCATIFGMLSGIRRRRFHSLRSAVLLILALGLAVQSLLDTAGQTHEAAAHAEIVLQQHDHAGEGEAAEGETLHVLLHHTHCCGHGAWMSGSDACVAILAMAFGDLPIDTASDPPAAGLATPFRPPIPA